MKSNWRQIIDDNMRRYQLSDREQHVANLLIRGMTNQEIADALGISKNTVIRHVESINTRLNTHARESVAFTLLGII